MGLRDRVASLLSPPPTAPVHVDAAVPVESRADAIFNWATGLGGLRDKGSIYNNRPDTVRNPLTVPELSALWLDNGIARRIVSLLPNEATRKGWSVPDIGDEDERLQIADRVREGMTWARLYGGAAGVLITEDDVPPAFRQRPEDWLMQPLDLRRVGRVEALHVFDAFEAQVGEYDTELRSPTYRQPLWWHIYGERGTLRVHASRVLHFRGAKRPPSTRDHALFPDDPVLQSVYDEVQRLCSTMQGGATLAHEIRESVLTIADLDRVAVSDQEQVLISRAAAMAKIKGLLGMILKRPGDTYENRSNPPTGFRELSGEAKSMLAGVVGWPSIVLFGEAPAGLSTDGSSGWQLMNRVASAYQEDNRSLIERAYQVVYSAQDGPTGGIVPDDHYLTFLPLDEPGEKEKAETRKLVADTDALYIDRGVLDPADIRAGRFGAEGFRLELGDLGELDAGPTFEEIEGAIGGGTPPPGADVQATALNGAQVQSALSIVSMVGARQLPRETGIASLQQFFSMSSAEAEHVMGPVGRTFFIEVPTSEPGRVDEFAAAVRRLDAVMQDSVCILIPAPTPRLEDPPALLGRLTVESEPHVSVLYLGTGLRPKAVQEVIAAVRAEAAAPMHDHVLEGGRLVAFPHGDRGTPVVVEYDGWSLERLHTRLLRRLAHLVRQAQFPTFRPHLTLGYLADKPTPEELSDLLAVDATAVRVPVAELHVVVGREVVARVPVGE